MHWKLCQKRGDWKVARDLMEMCSMSRSNSFLLALCSIEEKWNCYNRWAYKPTSLNLQSVLRLTNRGGKLIFSLQYVVDEYQLDFVKNKKWLNVD